MKTCVVAIAKHENEYINDWCRYNLSVGYDHIYIYDNNEKDYEYVGDRIDKDIQDKITIIDMSHCTAGVFGNSETAGVQRLSYQDFLDNHYDEYDWIAFNDIDEYINVDNVKAYLSKAPRNVTLIKINWQCYGDDNIVEGDLSIPVNQRFKIKLGDENRKINHYCKSIVRGHIKEVKFESAHSFNMKNRVQCDSHFNIIPNTGYPINKVIPARLDGVVINHYMTKTIKEYMMFKYNRIVKNGINANGLSYFFIVNEDTPEKRAYIEQYLKLR